MDAVKRAILHPVRAWNEAGNLVMQIGPEVTALSGRSARSQRLQAWWLAVRHGLQPQSYSEYRLYLPERRRLASRYVQEAEHTRLLRWLHLLDGDADAAIFRNKPRFAEWCREHGLPSVHTLLEMDEGRVVATTLDSEPAGALPTRDLFWKPNDATGGFGVESWRFVGSVDNPLWQASDGRVRDATTLLAELAEISRTLELRAGRKSRRMLLQFGLQNHPGLVELTPGALSTTRVVTYRSADGTPDVLRAALRLAVGTAPADNYAVGGIVAPVDLQTGRLLFGVRRDAGVLKRIERHPDSGTIISGFQLPHWSEVVDTCLKGLRIAHRMPLVGWDVAITNDGPVLVEGNMAPNPGLLQKHTGEPLSDTDFPSVLDALVRRRFAEQRTR